VRCCGAVADINESLDLFDRQEVGEPGFLDRSEEPLAVVSSVSEKMSAKLSVDYFREDKSR